MTGFEPATPTLSTPSWRVFCSGPSPPGAVPGTSPTPSPACAGATVSVATPRWLVAETHLKTAKEQISRIRADFAAWMDRPLPGLTPFLIENWRREQVKRGKKPVTANRDLQRLRALVSKAVEWKLLEVHPFAQVKPLRVDKRGRVRYLSKEEERWLRDALIKRETSLREARERFNTWRKQRDLQTLPARSGEFVDHVRPVTLLALNTGLRRGELLTLSWSATPSLSTRMSLIRTCTSSSKR